MPSKKVVTTLIAFVLANIAHGQPYAEQHSIEKNSITVNAIGSHSFGSTIVAMKLRATAAAKTVLEVQQNLSASETKLAAYLTTQKVQNLEAEGMSLRTKIDYNGNQSMITGYEGHSVIAFEIPLARFGILLDGSMKNGGTAISTIHYKTSIDIIEAARRFALEDAMRRAHREAEVEVEAMGKRLGSSLRVEVTDAFQPYDTLHSQRYTTAVRRGVGGGGFNNSIVGADLTVSAHVSLTFLLY